MLNTAYKFKRIFSGVMKFLLKSTYLKNVHLRTLMTANGHLSDFRSLILLRERGF